MQPESHTPRWAAITEQHAKGAIKTPEPEGKGSRMSRTNDLHHLAQKGASRVIGIGVGHRVAPRDKARGAGPRNKPVQEKTAVAISEDDLAGVNVGERATRDFDRVARPQRRQHTCPPNLKAQRAALPQSVHRYSRALSVSALGLGTHGICVRKLFAGKSIDQRCRRFSRKPGRPSRKRAHCGKPVSDRVSCSESRSLVAFASLARPDGLTS